MIDYGLILTIILITIILIAIIYFAWVFLFSKSILSYQLKSRDRDFLDLLDIMKAVLAEEYRMYEEDILQNRMTITNANFENYVKDMSSRVYNNLSPQFFDAMEVYVTREMIIRLITRSVKNFFQNKINGSIE